VAQELANNPNKWEAKNIVEDKEYLAENCIEHKFDLVHKELDLTIRSSFGDRQFIARDFVIIGSDLPVIKITALSVHSDILVQEIKTWMSKSGSFNRRLSAYNKR